MYIKYTFVYDLHYNRHRKVRLACSTSIGNRRIPVFDARAASVIVGDFSYQKLTICIPGKPVRRNAPAVTAVDDLMVHAKRELQ